MIIVRRPSSSRGKYCNLHLADTHSSEQCKRKKLLFIYTLITHTYTYKLYTHILTKYNTTCNIYFMYIFQVLFLQFSFFFKPQKGKKIWSFLKFKIFLSQFDWPFLDIDTKVLTLMERVKKFVSFGVILLLCSSCLVLADDIVHQDDVAPKRPGCDNDFVLVSNFLILVDVCVCVCARRVCIWGSWGWYDDDEIWLFVCWNYECMVIWAIFLWNWRW